MRELLLRLRLFLQAQYPILNLLSHEESRVLRALETLANSEEVGLISWTVSRGLHKVDSGHLAISEASQSEAQAVQQLREALRQMLIYEDPCIFALCDIFPYLDDPLVTRLLRDLSQRVSHFQQTIVLLGPQMSIPTELDKQLVVFDVPLPNEEDGARILSFVAQSHQLSLPAERFQRLVRGALGLTEEEIKRMYNRILLSDPQLSERSLSLQIEEKQRAIRKSRFLEFWDTQQLELDVGGLDSLKQWLAERQLAFSEEAQAYGLPQPKGLFLLGVQGCGKSLMAKSVADRWKLPLLRLDVASVLQAGAEEGLRDTIRVAESLAPVVLWIDELEKGFANSSDSVQQGLGTFLTWMQEKEKPVFVVATANEIRQLPPELLRKGRFDEIFFVDLPDAHERLEILDIHLRRRGRNPGLFDLTLVVEECERYSGAELEQLVIAAMFRAFSHNRELDTEDLMEASREIIPLAVTMDDRLKELRDWARSRARPASSNRRRLDYFSEWEETV